MKANLSTVTSFPTPIDPVFFRKEDIKIGSRLRYVGRSVEQPIEFVVHAIRAYHLVKGQYKGKAVQTVETLMDEIELVPIGKANQARPRGYGFTFQYLSYSAIWRLVP